MEEILLLRPNDFFYASWTEAILSSSLALGNGVRRSVLLLRTTAVDDVTTISVDVGNRCFPLAPPPHALLFVGHSENEMILLTAQIVHGRNVGIMGHQPKRRREDHV